MPANSLGDIFRITTFGESHGIGIGVVIDGCPAGLSIDEAYIQSELDRRRPGQSNITTARDEKDKIRVLSGVFEGMSTGHPITLFIENEDQRSKDYSHLKDLYRPSHADYTYQKKYGIRDYRGGGRSSARETAARVAAGAVAKLLLQRNGIQISGYVDQIGTVKVLKTHAELSLSETERSLVRCPDPKSSQSMLEIIEAAKAKGDSLGGTVSCLITGVPSGLGAPVFDKLHADLAKATMSINATRGFEIGSGFSAASMQGSEHNDEFILSDSGIRTASNHSGGIQGGISNGQHIFFRLAFKPVATISRLQQTVTTDHKVTELQAKGRHDPCVVPRAVPIVEAMAALVLADHLLRNRTVIL